MRFQLQLYCVNIHEPEGKKKLSSSLSNLTLESKTIFISTSISLLPHPPPPQSFQFPNKAGHWYIFKWRLWWWLINLGTALVFQWLRVHLPVHGTWDQSLVKEDPLEKWMATHSSILAWRTPWTEEPGMLQSMRSQRVGHDWATEQQVVPPPVEPFF